MFGHCGFEVLRYCERVGAEMRELVYGWCMFTLYTAKARARASGRNCHPRLQCLASRFHDPTSFWFLITALAQPVAARPLPLNRPGRRRLPKAGRYGERFIEGWGTRRTVKHCKAVQQACPSCRITWLARHVVLVINTRLVKGC